MLAIKSQATNKIKIPEKISFDDYLKVQQAKALYSSMQFILIGTLAISVLIVSIFWNAFPKAQLLIWLSASVLIILGRWLASRKLQTNRISPSNSQHWLNQFVFFTFLTGLHWGLVTVIFFSPDQPTYALFTAYIYTGYISLALSNNALYFPAFIAFSVPPTLQYITINLLQGSAFYNLIALLLTSYFILMLFFSRIIRRVFIKNCQISYERDELLIESTLQKENAQKAVNDKNQFLAAASHDLRQPLHAMGLFIDALRPHVKNTSGEEIVEKIYQSKHAINGLLHGLLDISRLDANVVENYPQHLKLSTMIYPVEKEYQLAAQQKGISLDIDVSPEHIAYIDPVLIERVLRNLIDNAIKYTNQGKVKLVSEEKATSIHLTIKDTGIGIPVDQLENVFIEFKQLNNPERDRKKGLGLGLSIVKRLCALMDIGFHIQSNDKQGTTIELILPKGNPEKVIVLLEPTRKFSLQSINVVVIDDEQDILDGMQNILSQWSCQVVLAVSGDEAIKALDQTDITPDIIIADFRLRNHENGIDVIERIREHYNREIKALLITGDTAPDRLQLTQTANLIVLHKPIESKDLNAQIQALLSN